jgi:pimeloyl-ACP methyl ester carboxylesterase
MPQTSPQTLRVPANGLEHNVLEWLPDAEEALESGTASARGRTILLIHGFMDAAATWDMVAPGLAARGYRVLAPDLRGYGDGARIAPGAYYYFTDYVFDVADLVARLVPADEELFVVGHSMGGSVVNMFTGTYPERVARLAVLEGAGPPDNRHDVAPDRMKRWIDEIRAVRDRTPRVMAAMEDALRRLVGNHPRVPEAVLRGRLDALARSAPGGGFVWKADPLHAPVGPVPFYAETWMAFARRITCPVLFVSGGPAGWHPPDEEARVACFARLTRAEIADAGHMMHWTEPAKLTRLLLEFFGADVIPGALSP